MNAALFLVDTNGRFHPATKQQFNKYAEHLGWLIKCDHIASRVILARIYHYRNAYELEQVLKTPGMPGPFDDAIPLKVRATEQLQDAIAYRNEFAMRLIFDRIKAGYQNVQSKFVIQQFLALELFSSPLVHEAAFRTLAGPRNTPPMANFSLSH